MRCLRPITTLPRSTKQSIWIFDSAEMSLTSPTISHLCLSVRVAQIIGGVYNSQGLGPASHKTLVRCVFFHRKSRTDRKYSLLAGCRAILSSNYNSGSRNIIIIPNSLRGEMSLTSPTASHLFQNVRVSQIIEAIIILMDLAQPVKRGSLTRCILKNIFHLKKYVF